MSSTTLRGASASSAASGKRRWTERDWDVLMEAQTFVAVYAETEPEPVNKQKKTNKKTRTSTRTRKGKASNAAATGPADDGEEPTPPPTATPVATESFWIAQLQDDVTEDMVEYETTVRVTWLNRVSNDDGNGRRYVMAYDDCVDVQAILCHVYLAPTTNANEFELTTKSLARAERSIRRTKCAATPEDEDESEDESPPRAIGSSKKSSRRVANDGDDDDDEGGSRRRRIARAAASKKISKRIAAMHIPPQYATVTLSKYQDRELLGDQDFDDYKDDIISSTRELIRAVRMKNYDLLKSLTEDKMLGAKIYSYRAYQSADVEKTALEYAIDAHDVKAIALLQQALRASPSLATGKVNVSLPSHSTGAHTSSYSDYNRRAIYASRGGREGNNALLEDDGDNCADAEDENTLLWNCTNTSVQLLAVFYPSGEWSNEYRNPGYVAASARNGNYKLTSKLVQVLEKNGGWGYNDLHVKSLSSTDEALPNFRSVSVVKKAQTTKVTPLHFAAINPNIKYLEALYDGLGAEQSDEVRDDAGFEPIHYAAANESPDAAKFLLEKKNASLLSRTKEKHTALMRALLVGREATAIAMLEYVATESSELCAQVVYSRGPSSYQLIHFAAENNCTKVLEHLLKMGVSVNALAANQTTPLSLAARQGHYESAKILLDHGAKVDRGDKLKKTPLMYAVKNGHTRLAAFLINNGANVNAYDTSENSTVHYAASYGWLSCLELLHDAGADLWSHNSWGFVPLICAMLKQRTRCFEYMLQRDSESRFLDFRDRSGCTLLYLQCQHSSNLDQIKFLLDKGLSPNIGDADGVKPLDVLMKRAARTAESPFFVDAVHALIDSGAQVDYSKKTDDDGNEHIPNQPLQWAIRSNLKKIFEVLLDEGKADPFIEEGDGTDAWFTSASQGVNGEFFLEQLLTRFPSPGALTARRSGGNIFHIIAASSKNMMPPKMAEKLLKLPGVDPSGLMNEKNSSGLSPIMVLFSNAHQGSYSKEKPIRSVDFAQIARLYASRVSDIEALKYYSVSDMPTENPSGEDETVVVTQFKETIFHNAARANLYPSMSKMRYGANLVDLVLRACPLSKSLIDIPERSSHITPLLIAVGNADMESIKLCIKNGADVNYSPVRWTSDSCNKSDRQCTEVCAAEGLKNTALIRAASKSYAVAKTLLEAGASTACYVSETLDGPLHCAINKRDVELTKLFVEYGASMVNKNSWSHTPLLAAVHDNLSVGTEKPHEGEVSYCKEPFGHGAVPLQKFQSSAELFGQGPAFGGASIFGGATATTTPRSRSTKTVVDTCLQHAQVRASLTIGDSYDRTALHHAAFRRDLPLLTALIGVFTDESAKSQYVNVRDVYSRTALHFALNSVSMKPDASFDIERFLLLSGADVHVADNFGLTPLHYTLVKIDMDWHHTYDSSLGKDVVEEQKAAGTYEALKHEAFAHHLHSASSTQADPVETVSNMLAAGCDPFVSDALGRLPMHLAASAGGFVCVSTLLSACPPASRHQMLEHEDVHGFTPLGRAFLQARETTITTLIQSGAVVSNKVVIGGRERSYFSVAVEKGMSGICHMLLNAGFSRRQAVEDAVCGNQLQLATNLIVGLEISSDRGLLGAPNSRQQTLLHCLAMHVPTFSDANQLATELAWSLVDQGIKVQARDEEGNTALHYAAKLGNVALMDFLLHHGADLNEVNKHEDTPLMYALKNAPSSSSLRVVQYMLWYHGLDLRRRGARGLDTLALIVDHFMSVFNADDKFFAWFELALREHGSLNELYPVAKEEDSDEKKALENPRLLSPSVQSPAAPLLVRVLAADSYQTRFKLLASLIKNKASTRVVDSHGNTVLMYLVSRNLVAEATLVVSTAPGAEVKAMLNTVNRNGFTALHLAVQTFEYGSFENVEMVDLLIRHGASLDAMDAQGESVLDYVRRQKSGVLLRFLKAKHGELVKDVPEDEGMDMETWHDVPAFEQDAKDYLDECYASNKITKTRVDPEVDDNVDVGEVSSVYGLLDANGKVMEGEEYDVVLTKVDVKAGRFGVNVFYKTQVVHDELQGIYIVFTNWGRIGEDGKFQNTPFHSANEAVTEFKKIFKSKTSKAWEDRHQFEKKRGKYSLVERANYHTTIENDVMKSFAVQREEERALLAKGKHVEPAFAPMDREELDDPPLLNALFAITDIRYLKLAATERCDYHNDLPLARDEDLRAAMAMLRDIRAILERRVEIKNEIDEATSALATDDSSAADALTELSDKFEALTDEVSEHSSRFYEIVPRNESSDGAPIGAFTELSEVDQEMQRLTQLLEIAHTYKMLLGAKRRQKEIHPIAYIHDAMQTQFSRVASKDEHDMLTRYFVNGIRPSKRGNYRVSNIFEVKRRGEANRLAACIASDPAFTKDDQHTQLLWHGTRRTNLMGILTDGLRIAPHDVPHNGAAFGKGIYFSDVAEQSIHYCDSPYTVEVEEEDSEDEDAAASGTEKQAKTRQVNYMLLCEVALGNQVDVNSLRDRQDGVHSIRAFGRDMPDEGQSIVSSASGVQLPIGRVRVRGKQFACASAWAFMTHPDSNRKNFCFAHWSIDAEAYLNNVLDSANPWTRSKSIDVESDDHKSLFIREGWYSCSLNELVKLEIRIADVPSEQKSQPSPCDVVVEFVVTPPPSEDTTSPATEPYVVATGRRYRRVLFSQPPELPKEFSFVKLDTIGQYNQHIVYSPEQVRIRYVVEVERLGRSSHWW